MPAATNASTAAASTAAAAPAERAQADGIERAEQSADVSAKGSPGADSEAERLAELQRAIQELLADPKLAKLRVSLVVAPAGGGVPLVRVAGQAPRVPASNAKLLTTTAAALTLRGYRFVTEISRRRRGGPLYVWGTGDPLFRRRDLKRIARRLRARGVRSVRGVVVDDSYFTRRRLAPGFEAFSEGAYYRPTAGALNIDGNAVVIEVSAPRSRRRPRVDVTPPSDYVKVRKLVRFIRAPRGRRGRKLRRKRKVRIAMRPRGSILWLDISGKMGRKARPVRTRRAVYDPALNLGWALRRALKNAGIAVSGTVRRGRRPRHARVLARRRRSLSTILRITNTHSDNLAAELLVRAMGALGTDREGRHGRGRKKGAHRGSWKRGLKRLHAALAKLGVTRARLHNGSGLHRHSRVSADELVLLLQRIYGDARLRALLLPTLAVAGESGTIRHRMRDTPAAGYVHAKTGTLAGALALSGYVCPESDRPLVFSMLVNGSARRSVRARIDRIAELLARYARGMPLEDPPATPASEPVAAAR